MTFALDCDDIETSQNQGRPLLFCSLTPQQCFVQAIILGSYWLKVNHNFNKKSNKPKMRYFSLEEMLKSLLDFPLCISDVNFE